MVVYQVVIEKFLGGEYWVNDYHVSVPDFAGAKAAAEEIAAIERNVSATSVGFTKYRIRPVGSTAQGTVFPLGYNGQNTGIGAWLPLYCTARVDFSPPSGRPGRKYMKFPTNTIAQTNGQFNAAFLDNINQYFCAPLILLGVLCKENGAIFTQAAVQPMVQMRQLRRGSKRKLQPII